MAQDDASAAVDLTGNDNSAGASGSDVRQTGSGGAQLGEGRRTRARTSSQAGPVRPVKYECLEDDWEEELEGGDASSDDEVSEEGKRPACACSAMALVLQSHFKGLRGMTSHTSCTT